MHDPIQHMNSILRIYLMGGSILAQGQTN